jgi:hypothetical protein
MRQQTNSAKGFFENKFSEDAIFSYPSNLDTYVQPHRDYEVQNPERVGDVARFEWIAIRHLSANYQQGWVPYPSEHMAHHVDDANKKGLPWLRMQWEDRSGRVTVPDGANSHLVLMVTSAKLIDKVNESHNKLLKRSSIRMSEVEDAMTDDEVEALSGEAAISQAVEIVELGDKNG